MPIINISIIEGRSAQRKTRLISEITNVVSECMGAPKEAIRVLINEIPASHWGVAGVPKSEPKLEKAN